MISLKIERRTKINFKNNLFLILNLNLFYYSNLINARPFSIADEVGGSNNYLNNFVVNSNEREQYKEAMEIARETFFQLRPLTTTQEQTEKQQNKLKLLTLLNREQKQRKKQQKQQQNNQDNENIEPDNNIIPQQQQLPIHSTQPMLPLHISSDIVNNTLQSNTCQGDLFKHKIKLNGCKPKSITNRFCHGSCSSFYIPRLRSKKLKATFQSCSACIPAEVDTIQVRLECPDLEKGYLYRKIVRVKKCACRNIMLEGEEMGGDNNNNENVLEDEDLNDYNDGD
uniref:Bursicon n=1 Tax=Meloidogyne floridensis TaxID=298350 RepID=A0A915NUT3_9BILA